MPKMRYVVIILAYLFLSALAQAASFDCTKAATKIEKLICSDLQLSKSDEDLMVIYVKVLKETDNADQIKKRQREWISKVRNLCADVDCLRDAYTKRLTQLASGTKDVRTDQSYECFNRLANKPLPFEIYHEYGGQRVFFQPVGDKFGLSDKGFEFKPDANSTGIDEIGVAPLCDGNYITIRKYSHHRFPIPLTGRIIGKDYLPLGSDFLISDYESNAGVEHSVTTIYPKGFVAIWRIDVGRSSLMKTKIKGRLFDNNGKPRGRSFDISTSSGLNVMPIVRGLPDGGFIVLWNRYRNGVYFKVFDHYGKPQTKEVTVYEDHPQPSLNAKQKEGVQIVATKSCNPLLSVSTTKEDTIDIFVNCNSNKYDKTRPFYFFDRFDSMGKPLTVDMTDEEIENYEGYKLAMDQYVKKVAGRLDVSRRRDFQRSSSELLWCKSQYGTLVEAAETKSLTNDPKLKNFFTEYCQTFQKNCHITQKYEEKIIEKCLRED